MRPPIQSLSLATLLWTTLSLSAPACLLRGPVFPPPKNLSANPTFQAAAQNLTGAFEYILLNETTIVAGNNSWSIEAWSIHEEKPIWSHYHTAFNHESLNTTGTQEVDERTIYRLGSLTKIFTVMTWLAVEGDIHWTTPITEYIPELKDLQARTKGLKDGVRYMDWDVITVGSLAGQMSGIPRDYSLIGEMTQEYGPNLVYLGFPPPDQIPETPPCGVYPLCNRTEFFKGLEDLMPTFAPEASPAYSNVAYMLLAFALENITGKEFLTLLTENILDPLGLEDTYYTTPDDPSRGIIPGNASTVGWYNRLGDANPTGSMFASSRDLTRLGKAILSSEILPEAVTRRWLRPVTFTSDPMAALGTPWGVRRINMGHPYYWTYGYQKAGRIGDYSALLIMLPDFDIGISILTAGPMPANMNFDFADAVGMYLLPAVDRTSRDEARVLYEGDYDYKDDTLNSTITVIVDDEPGLNVARWISNGTDMASISVQLMLSTTAKVTPRIRLFPSGLETLHEDGSKDVGFKAILEDAAGGAREGRLFSTDCASWLTATSLLWSARALDEFVFHHDPEGNVVSIEPVALRAPLNKMEGPPSYVPPAEEENDNEADAAIPEIGKGSPSTSPATPAPTSGPETDPEQDDGADENEDRDDADEESE